MIARLAYKTFVIFSFAVLLTLSSNIAFAKVEILDTEFTGTINETGSYSDVSGNKNFSFVDEGSHLTNDFLIKAKKRLKHEWKWDMDVRVRKTTDQEVDTRQDVHLLQLTTRVSNPNSQFQFGDYYTRFTDMTLNRSLEGFNYQANYNKVGTRLNLVAARQYRGFDNIQYSRYVWGYHFDQDLIKKKFLFINQWTVGQTIAQTFDRRGSIGQDTGVPDLNNLVGSINTRIRAIEDLNVNIELGKSMTGDHNDILLAGDIYGYAFRLRSDYRKKSRFGQTYLNFDYEWIAPNFAALSGSVLSDREAYYAGITQNFNQNLSAIVQFRAIRNNLDDTSFTTTRTANPRFSLRIMPFNKVPDFVISPYYDLRSTHASNSTIDNNVQLVGVEATKRIWFNVKMNAGYDLRKRLDDAGVTDETANDYHMGFSYDWIRDNIRISPNFDFRLRNDRFDDVPNRTTFRNFVWGVSSEFYKRFRVYFNYGINYDDRSFADSDTNYFSWNVSGEYDLLDNLMLVIGWRQYDQHFQRNISDFEENVGSIRLQYKY